MSGKNRGGRFAGVLLLVSAPLFFQEPQTGPLPETGQRAFTDDLGAFRYEPGKLEPGVVYQYRHSNVDGSHASRVSLYVAAEDRLEALKWNPGWSQATLVVAELDWKTFSVKGFETSVITAGGERTPRAELQASEDGRELVARAGPNELRCTIEHLPWVSYDFDLASLNVAMRFLADPEGVALLSVADAVQGAGGMRFAYKGTVELRYLEDDERAGIACRKYAFDGEGMEGRGGHIWAAADEERFFVDFEMDLADEPGFTSGKLLLLERAELSADEWQAAIRASVP